jgi:hypothetical protein
MGKENQMKNILWKISPFLPLLAGIATAATLEWDANPEPEIGGYKVYRGTGQRVVTPTATNYVVNEFTWEVVADVGNVTHWTVPKWQGEIFLCVTAYTTNGLESDFSEWVRAYRPKAPTNLRIGGDTIKIINQTTVNIYRSAAKAAINGAMATNNIPR